MDYTFMDWLTGDASHPIAEEYSFLYWMTLLCTLLVLSAVVFVALAKKIPEKTKEGVLRGLAIFQLAFEILWRIVYLVFKHSTFADIWPMYPCNLGGVLVPIIALCNWKRGKDLFYVFAFIGACLSFALPGGMFCFDVMSFPLFKSAFQHTGILMIPLMEYCMKKYRPSVKDFKYLFVGCLVHIFNCEAIDQWLGLDPVANDYMYLRQGYPFEIPGVPSPFVTCAFGLLIFVLFLFAINPKQSIADFKELGLKIKGAFSKKQ